MGLRLAAPGRGPGLAGGGDSRGTGHLALAGVHLNSWACGRGRQTLWASSWDARHPTLGLLSPLRSSHHGHVPWAGPAFSNQCGPEQQGASLERCHALGSKDTASGFGLPIWTPLMPARSKCWARSPLRSSLGGFDGTTHSGRSSRVPSTRHWAHCRHSAARIMGMCSGRGPHRHSTAVALDGVCGQALQSVARQGP